MSSAEAPSTVSAPDPRALGSSFADCLWKGITTEAAVVCHVGPRTRVPPIGKNVTGGLDKGISEKKKILLPFSIQLLLLCSLSLNSRVIHACHR